MQTQTEMNAQHQCLQHQQHLSPLMRTLGFCELLLASPSGPTAHGHTKDLPLCSCQLSKYCSHGPGSSSRPSAPSGPKWQHLDATSPQSHCRQKGTDAQRLWPRARGPHLHTHTHTPYSWGKRYLRSPVTFLARKLLATAREGMEDLGMKIVDGLCA